MLHFILYPLVVLATIAITLVGQRIYERKHPDLDAKKDALIDHYGDKAVTAIQERKAQRDREQASKAAVDASVARVREVSSPPPPL